MLKDSEVALALACLSVPVSLHQYTYVTVLRDGVRLKADWSKQCRNTSYYSETICCNIIKLPYGRATLQSIRNRVH